MGTAILLRSVIVLAGLCVLLCIPLFLAADGGGGAGAAIAVIQLLALIVGFGGGVLLLFVRRGGSVNRSLGAIAVAVCGSWLAAAVFLFLTFTFPAVG